MSGDLRFKIGDMAWIASFDSCDDGVICPDCGGTGRLRVIFHDETQVSIACQNCAVGYDPPTGRVRVYKRTPRVQHVHINGFEVGANETRFRLGYSDNCYHTVADKDLFDTQEEAQTASENKCVELDEADKQKVLTKEKDTRTWAWNASYHRKQIKEANRQIVYHTAKLTVAAIKAKEPTT